MRPQPSLCPACWRRRRKSFKEESPPNGEFYPIPCHTHPFFIVIPNRPSHISHPRLPPTSLIQSPPPFFCSSNLTPLLHLPFVYTSLSSSSLLIPPHDSSSPPLLLLLPSFPSPFDFLLSTVLHSLPPFFPSSILVLSGGLWQ